MDETLERELKLRPGVDFQLPDGDGQRSRRFTSTYYDTNDRRLAASGITLRRRVENRKSLWQLKLPLASGRRELELAAGPGRPPDGFTDLLVALARGRTLEPVAALRTQRSSVELREDGARAEVAFDEVAVLEGRRVLERFEELEVELLEGDEKALERIGRRLRRAGAEDGDGRPKLFRVLGLEPTADVPSDASPLEHLRAMLARQLDAILRHDPGVRLGSDPEDLHDLRVATRRLRALLRAARPLLDRGWAEGLRGELSWLGSALGPVRDLDVLVEHLQSELAELPSEEGLAGRRLVQALESERADTRAGMLDALESERYLRLLDAVEEAARGPRAAREAPELSLEDIAAAEFRRLRKAVRRLPATPSDEELHKVRIKGKRARYAAELAAASVGKKAERFVSRAKAFQDVIGDHQDAIVAEERIRSLLASGRSARVAFVAGVLVERGRERRRAARAEWRRTWKRLERAGGRAWT